MLAMGVAGAVVNKATAIVLVKFSGFRNDAAADGFQNLISSSLSIGRSGIVNNKPLFCILLCASVDLTYSRHCSQQSLS